MERRTPNLTVQPPKNGKLITILSIDGGGIRGIISGVILAYLEYQLQVVILKTNLYIYEDCWLTLLRI